MKIAQRPSAVEAYYSPHGKMEERVYGYLVRCGSRGATILEIASALGVESNRVTGRLHDMLDKGNGGRNARVFVAPYKRICDKAGTKKIVWVAVVKVTQMSLIGG